MIEHVLRTASSFAEAAELDRQDVARMTFEQRISEVERLRRIWFGEDRAEALVAFGFGGVVPTPAELARPHKVFMLGRKPWRIDILTSIDGVSFAQA